MEEQNEKVENREQWTSKSAFILAAIGSAVGLGNIWRYPYVVYDNGGGAFLIPYFIAIVTAGIPLLIMEFSIGHKYRGSAPLAMRRMNPKFEWIGWFPSIVAGLIVLYYVAILSWALNYMFLSVGRMWGPDPTSFFTGEFLQATSSAFDMGGVRIPVLLGLLVIWFITWLCCYKQIKGIEKANKILLPALLVMAIIIIVRGLLLPGSMLGLKQLFTPQWSELTNVEVWMEAYGQVFFSLSLAMGIMITFSSYLPKKTDINNSALITAFSNSAFEFCFAIGVFAILGFMATTQNVPVSEVVDGGIGLSFMVFPQCFNEMSPFAGGLLGVCFFGALVFAGLTSLISLIEAFAAPFLDKFNFSRKKLITVICIVGGLASCIYATGAGLIILDIVDKFLNSYALVVIGLLEAVVIGWVFGAEKILAHANETSYFKIGKWWIICIKYILPSILSVTIILSLRNLLQEGYGGYTVSELIFFGVSVVVFAIISAIVLSKMKWRKNKD